MRAFLALIGHNFGVGCHGDAKLNPGARWLDIGLIEQILIISLPIFVLRNLAAKFHSMYYSTEKRKKRKKRDDRTHHVGEGGDHVAASL